MTVNNKMDAIPSIKIENNRVYIQCTSNNSVLQEVQKFKDLNLFCDVILEAKCDKTEDEIRKEKLLVWSRRVRVFADQQDDVEKWEQLPVHSCIIAAGSKVLKNKMLNVKSHDASYTIKNINMKYLKICIDFLYRLPISFSTDEIANVLSAAKFLGIDDLQPWCKAAEESNRKAHSVKSLNLSIGAVNVKTKDQLQQHIEPVAKIPRVIKTSLPHSDTSMHALVSGPKLKIYNNKSDNDKMEMGDSNNANDTDDYDALWELEKMDNLNNVKWNVPFDDESDIELDYFLGNPRFTTENNSNLEPLRLYNCVDCEKDFTSSDHFCDKSGKNMRLRRKYLCQICGFFVSNRSFTIHIKTHLQIKDFKCDVCGYTAISKVRIREHQHKHLTNKTLKCDLCDKSYKSKAAFREHKVIAHNQVSDYQYKRQKDLPYQCPECDFHCGSHSIAFRHARTKHRDCITEEMNHFIKIHKRIHSQAAGKATNPNNSNSEEFEHFPNVQHQDNETISIQYIIESEHGNCSSEQIQQYVTIHTT